MKRQTLSILLTVGMIVSSCQGIFAGEMGADTTAVVYSENDFAEEDLEEFSADTDAVDYIEDAVAPETMLESEDSESVIFEVQEDSSSSELPEDAISNTDEEYVLAEDILMAADDSTEEMVFLTLDPKGGIFNLEGSSEPLWRGAFSKGRSAGWLPTPEKDDAFFDGWSSDGTEEGRIQYDKDEDYYLLDLAENTTFYALWIPAVPLTWDANGKEFVDYGTTRSMKMAAGDYITEYSERTWEYIKWTPKAADGKAFTYWSLDPEGEEKLKWDWSMIDDTEYNLLMTDDEQETRVQIKEDGLTIYANWADGIEITFDGNGGSLWDDDDNLVSSVTKTVPAGYAYELNVWGRREGYELFGWKNGKTGEWYDAEGQAVFTEPVTLYADWSENKTITIDFNGGYYDDYDDDTDGYVKKSVITVVSSMGQWFSPYWWTEEDGEATFHAPAGHVLAGWSKTRNGAIVISEANRGEETTGNTTYYAVWAAGSHTFGPWSVAKAASTTESGIESHTCSGCGFTELREIPRLPEPITVSKEPITVSKKPTIKNPAAAKGKITVNWKHFKQTKKTKSIWKKIKKVQVQCATDKGFANIVKSTMVGKKKTKAAIKGLAKKTTYYVRVRYYDGTGYSAWSKVKKVKTK